MKLFIESKSQTSNAGIMKFKNTTMLITPGINKDYFEYRVKLSEKQAVLGFKKFLTLGIGFSDEVDWNTNLPFTCPAIAIYEHIKCNSQYRKLHWSKKKRILRAIEMIQAQAKLDGF